MARKIVPKGFYDLHSMAFSSAEEAASASCCMRSGMNECMEAYQKLLFSLRRSCAKESSTSFCCCMEGSDMPLPQCHQKDSSHSELVSLALHHDGYPSSSNQLPSAGEESCYS